MEITISKGHTGADGNEARFPRTLAVVRQAIADGAVPCCAFGLFAGQTVQLTGALGQFTPEPGEPAVTAQTRFDIASLTKVVATTAALQLLHAQGRFDLDQPLAEALPEFAAARPAGDPALKICLRHLLAHSSGMPAHREYFLTARNAEQLWEQLMREPLEALPGERSEYSDLGFLLLGRFLERLTGEPLDPWCQREIFTPLGMHATGFCPAPELRGGIPPTELDARSGERMQGVVQDENCRLLGGVAGHAGLFSTAPDLLRFSAAILGGSPLFCQKTLKTFAQRQAPAGSSRALGWDMPSENSTAGRSFSSHSIGHLGFSGCSLWIDLEARLAAVLLTNRSWPDRTNQAIRALRPAFHDALREDFSLLQSVT